MYSTRQISKSYQERRIRMLKYIRYYNYNKDLFGTRTSSNIKIYTNLNIYADRLKTFKSINMESEYKSTLAKLGFFKYQNNISCYYCNGKIPCYRNEKQLIINETKIILDYHKKCCPMLDSSNVLCPLLDVQNEYNKFNFDEELNRFKSFYLVDIEDDLKIIYACIGLYYIEDSNEIIKFCTKEHKYIRCHFCKYTSDLKDEERNSSFVYNFHYRDCPLLFMESSNVPLDESLYTLLRLHLPILLKFSGLCYNKEIDRKKTLKYIFKCETIISNFALFGYYFDGKKIKCYFCNLHICPYQKSIFEFHRCQSNAVITPNIKQNRCPLLTGANRHKNIPINENELSTIINNYQYEDQNPEFITITSRLESFKYWPSALTQTPAQLATAGFFYDGIGDKVTCYSCGVCINNWKINSIPFVEHAKNLVVCSYMVSKKGLKYIQSIKSGITDIIEDCTDKSKGMCVVCKENPSTILLQPCNHISMCGPCFIKFEMTNSIEENVVYKCPICRSNVTNNIKVFIV